MTTEHPSNRIRSILTGILLFAAAFTLSAGSGREPVKLNFYEPSRITFSEDSATVRLLFTVPDEMNRKRLFHKFEIWMVSDNDPELSEKLFSVEATGKARTRRENRISRREGRSPGRVMMKYRHKKGTKRDILVLTDTVPFQPWMDEGVHIRIEQHNSMRFRDPVVSYPPEFHRPKIRSIDRPILL